MDGLQWYVLKVVSRQEESIKSSIQAELIKVQLDHVVKEILIPYERVYEIHDGKKIVKNKTLFPGYLLLHVDLSNDLIVQVVRRIPGVLGFLGAKGWGMNHNKPVPLSQSDVKRVVGKSSGSEEVALDLHAVFVVGEVIEIIDGPFAGFSGNVQEIFEEKKTLNVTVKIFDERSTPVELSYTQVKKVS